MKAKAFKNIGLWAMTFATLASPLSAYEVCNNQNSNAGEATLLATNSITALSRQYWNQQARYFHDAAVALGSGTNGLTIPSISAQILALNNANGVTSTNVGNLYAPLDATTHHHHHKSSSSAENKVTAAEITNLLNLFFQAGVVTFATYQDGDSAGGLASYNNWQSIGNQIAIALNTLNSKIDLATVQQQLNLYVQLQDQQFFNYSTGNTAGTGNGSYAAGLNLNDQAIALADQLGHYLGKVISGHHVKNLTELEDVAMHNANYIPCFNVQK